MARQSADVIIIGVGATGGIIAAELAKIGLKVIGLERGPRLTNEDYEARDELRFFQRADLRPDPKRAPVTYRADPRARANPLPVLNFGNGVGGGTVHYGTLSWRMLAQNFRTRSHTIERYGADAIPEGSGLIDWPISWDEIEPYYDRAEYEIGIAGKAGNIQGLQVDGGNPFESPRAREFPLPPVLPDYATELFDKSTRELGYHPFPSPKAIATRPYNGRPGCTYCGFCQSFGCHVDAKSSILVTKIPEAEATGNFDLRTGTMVYRINSDNSGRVTGVSYWGPGGTDETIEADIVVLSPFTNEAVRQLLISTSDRFPNGLANSNGMVGKYYFAQVGAGVLAGFDTHYMHSHMGPNNGRHSIDDFESDNFDHSGLGFIQGAQIAVGSTALAGGPIGVALAMNPPTGQRWGPIYRDFLAKYYERHVSISPQVETIPYMESTIDLDPNVKDSYGLPAPRVTYDWRRPEAIARVQFLQEKAKEIATAMGASVILGGTALPGTGAGTHQAGGTRMGDDPHTSVVNRYGQTWDVPNLFISGGSIFPTQSGHNPTLTMQAVAYWTADAIIQRYVKDPGPLVS